MSVRRYYNPTSGYFQRTPYPDVPFNETYYDNNNKLVSEDKIAKLIGFEDGVPIYQMPKDTKVTSAITGLRREKITYPIKDYQFTGDARWDADYQGYLAGRKAYPQFLDMMNKTSKKSIPITKEEVLGMYDYDGYIPVKRIFK